MQLRDDEVVLLAHLIDGLEGLLAEGDGAPDDKAPGDGAPDAEAPDEAAAIAGFSWPDSDPITVPDDPAIRRLLPDAYRDDPEAAAEFRRYTDAPMREGMRADVDVVRATLAGIGAAGHATLDDDTAQAWLRVLNRLRLVLAERLGIERAEDQDELDRLDEDDPRHAPYEVYSWVGYVLSELLEALT
jgi:hypothetical protein